MADIEFSHGMGAYGRSEYTDEAPRPSLVTLTNIAGALVSVALISGVGVWGYELMVRDVSGIPVVRAAQGEMRVRPDDPGGQLARHQGLAVNEIAANGEAAGPVDQVKLAPPAVGLAAEDQPIVTLEAATPVTQPEPLAPAASSLGKQKPSAKEEPGQEQRGSIDDVVAALLAETPVTDAPEVGQAGADYDPAETVTMAAETETATSSATEPKIEAPGPQRSARPRLRPANVQSLIRPASFTPPAASREVDPAAIPSGTRLAQLGAFESPEVARSEWRRMQRIFGDILAGKSRVVQQVESGGRTFFRLRAMGFVGLDDTRRFCSAVKAEGVDCIPVQVK